LTKAAETSKTQEELLNDLIIDAIQDIKGKNITKFDLRHLHDRPTNYFIICEGESSTQVNSIIERVKKRVRDEMNIMPHTIEGKENAKWVLADYFTTVVHVFYKETREYYDLDDLWSDAKITRYEDL
jgi:ribosome-associated protein